MRFALCYQVEPGEFPLDYRPFFVTAIRQALKREEEELATQLYAKGRVKPFTFSIIFSRKEGAKIFPSHAVEDKEEKIKVGSRLVWQFSCAEPAIGLYLYNALMKFAREIHIGENYLALLRVQILPEPKIKKEIAIFETLSPVLLRHPYKGNWYMLPGEEEYLLQLQKEVGSLMRACGLLSNSLPPLLFQPLVWRRVVILHYGQPMQGFVGAFRLISLPAILNLIYQGGLGSRRSQGFGMLRWIS